MLELALEVSLQKQFSRSLSCTFQGISGASVLIRRAGRVPAHDEPREQPAAEVPGEVQAAHGNIAHVSLRQRPVSVLVWFDAFEEPYLYCW